MTIDVLAIGAHPDDVELGVGGVLLKLVHQGFTTGILDLTEGEMSSRGGVDERRAESAEAARRLKASVRESAGLPDGALHNSKDHQRAVIPFIRALRPKVILAHMKTDRHPDHRVAHELTRDANFFAGVTSIKDRHEAYRAPYIYYFHPYYEDDTPPSMIVDVSNHFEEKLEALRAHRSQFFNPDYKGEATFVSSPAFWEAITTRARYWGHRIGVDFGEPLYAEGPLAVEGLPGLGVIQ